MQQLKFNSLLTLSKLRATSQYFSELRTLRSQELLIAFSLVYYGAISFNTEVSHFRDLKLQLLHLANLIFEKLHKHQLELYPQN